MEPKYYRIDELPIKMKEVFDMIIDKVPFNGKVETKKLVTWFETLREELIKCPRIDSRVWSYLKSRDDLVKVKGLRGVFEKIKKHQK